MIAPGQLDRRTRIALAVAMPLGPACVAALHAVMPTFTASTATETAAAIVASPARQSAMVWLDYGALLMLIPGVLAVAWLTRRTAPRLTWWAVAVLAPAYLSLPALVAEDAKLWDAQDAGFSVQAIARLYDHQHPALVAATAVFIAGHVLGTVLLGLALLRSRQVAAPFGWALTASQPLHFLAFVVLGVQPLDVFAWGLAAVGMAAAAVAVLRARPVVDEVSVPQRAAAPVPS